MAKAKVESAAGDFSEGSNFDESKFETVRHVTRPTLSLKTPGTVVYFTVEEPMHIESGEAKEGKKPATILNVINLRTGVPSQIVAPIILQNALNSYGDGGYVGKSFKVSVGDIIPGGTNRVRALDVLEVRF